MVATTFPSRPRQHSRNKDPERSEPTRGDLDRNSILVGDSVTVGRVCPLRRLASRARKGQIAAHVTRLDPPPPSTETGFAGVGSALTPALAESERLHARVRRFAEVSLDPPLVLPDDAPSFETLALEIAQFQLTHCPGFARLVTRIGSPPSRVDDIPAVTVDTFRLTRVAVHPPELDAHVFRTSGTTGVTSGRHPLRSPLTYQTLALALARRTLFAHHPRGIVVALAENPGQPSASSLGLMMQLFMQHMDGEALMKDPRGASFQLDDPGRWLIRRGMVDTDGLRRAFAIARARGRPLFLLTTGFALAATLEALDGEPLRAPKNTRVMLTGGFKGRRTELTDQTIRSQTAETFCIPESSILGEYGMTELTSQLYQSWSSAPAETDPLSQAGWRPPANQGDLYFAPPWLRVTAVDPTTGRRVSPGQPGLARFCDLGNIDSALVVVTEDLIVEQHGGIRLLGRRRGAPPRGCSLPFEGLIARSPTS